MSAASAALFDERIDPGKVSSAVLAAAVHLALLAVLVFGVSWQNRPPEAVSVELWEPPAPAPAAQALAPVVKPEPVVPKPDIALKAAPPKVELKPAPKPEAVKPKIDQARKHLQAELAREQASLAIDHERQQNRLANDAAATRNKGLAEYEAKIRAKVRGNIILPPGIQGNPEAVFLVVQLPTGEVLSSKPMKSSGHRGYDEAVERAILKSSPLPKPDRTELFSRELKLTFRPKD